MSFFLEHTRRFATKRLLISMLAAATTLASPALAEESKRHAAFQQGIAAMQAEKWDEALAIYQKLWAEEHTYDVALSLGQTELNLKAYRDAAEHLDFGYRNIPPREDAAVTTRAGKMLDVARAEVGAIEIRVDRTNAEVTVDGKMVGLSPLRAEVFVEPGSHTIEAKSEGSTPIVQAVHVKAGQKNVLNLAFGDRSGSAKANAGATPQATPVAAPAAAAQPPADAKAVTSDDDSGVRNAVLLTGVGVTAVAAAVTVVFALKGSSADSDADDARARATAKFGPQACSSSPGAQSLECSELASALDSRGDANAVANTALFIGVVAGVSTAVTFFLWPTNASRPEQASPRLVPRVGRDEGGLLVTGSF